MENKFKHLLCVNMGGSSDGAIRFAIEKIKKHNIRIELFMIVPKANILRALITRNSDQADLTESNHAKKYLKTISDEICDKTGYRPEFNVHSGDLNDMIEKKLMNDLEICSILLGSTSDSWKKKKSSSLMLKIFQSSRIPIIIIPQGITDIQIDNLITND